MADIVGLKTQQQYQYYAGRKTFKKNLVEQFKTKLGIKYWHNELPDYNQKLLQVLYKRIIKLESGLTGRSTADIKKDIDLDVELE